MKKLNIISKKLRSRKGESLVELLVSILICTLSMVCLLTSITTTSDITKKSRVLIDEYYNANNTIEKMIAGQSAGTDENVVRCSGSIVVKGKTGENGVAYAGQEAEYRVDVYINKSVAAGTNPVVIYDYVSTVGN